MLLLLLATFALTGHALTAPANDSLAQAVIELQKNPADTALREKIIKLAAEMNPAPAIPEEAKKFMVRGITAMEDAKSERDFAEAVGEFSKALQVAPWLANGYRNLAIAQDKAGGFKEALGNLNLYLLTEPAPADVEWAKQFSYKIEYRRDKAKNNKGPFAIAELGIEMIAIPAGTFEMGSENGNSDEKPVTRVTFSKPFWLGKTEVTQGQWQALMGSNPANFKGDDRPVETVSWDDAMEFCRKLTERERVAGRLPEGYAYTLPTEAQWEYACRAGTTGDYAGNLDDMGWYDKNSGSTTHPVAQKQANAWGLYDMHGNVWEWCLDWYAEKLPGGSVTDPAGPSAGTDRVSRGGGWISGAGFCRSAHRYWYVPGNRFNFLGFRVSLAPQVSR